MTENIVPRDILDKANEFFNTQEVLKAKALNEEHKINISFHKKRSDDGFIISGILLDSDQQSSRCTYKKSENLISSSCSCNVWTPEKHCHHVAALFMKYFLLNYFKERYEALKEEGGKINLRGMGAHPKKYGTVITSPKQLEGASINSTYSSLQYILTSNKIQNFPIPQKFEGKLSIKIIKATDLEIYKGIEHLEDKFTCFFEHIQEDKTIHEVSLFEYLYLFNWNTGDAYHLPDLFKEFIKAIKIKDFLVSIDDLILLLRPVIEKELVEIIYNENKVDFENAKKAEFQIYIQNSDRKNYLELVVRLINDQEILAIPTLFKTISLENGFLDHFKTKNEAIEFAQFFKDSLKNNDNFYKRHIHGSVKKDKINEWSDSLKYEKTYFFHSDQLYFFENSMFKILFVNLIESFSNSIIRYSGIDYNKRELFYQIPKNILLDGVPDFYQELDQIGIDIFYNKNKVRTWTNSIKFERNESNLNWFDLTLNVNADDLKVINKADISEQLLVSDDQMMLLTKEQRDILKFMQKYTKYEKTTADGTDDNNKRFGLTLKRARIFELFELRKLGIEGALTEEEIKLCDNLQNLQEIPEYPIPGNFTNIPRPYQVTGYNWLNFLFENGFGACLADDMGLGKTIQTIMFLESILDKIDRAIIICPVSILLNWKNEIQKFASFGVNVYYGDDRKLPFTEKVVLTSYGIMKKEAQFKFKDQKFDIVVFDEVQHLKNSKSLGASSARALNAGFRICLTGTPVENDISEFFNILDLAVPGVWGEMSFFRGSSTRKNRLLAKKVVKPFILRRRKSEVLKELPDKIEQYVYLNFSEDEKNNYANHLINIREKIRSESVRKKYGEILKSLLELRQMCLWQQNGSISTKIEFLTENLEQLIEEGHKIIVFSQFTTYLDLIEKEVVKNEWKFSRIDGSMTMKKRQKQVEQFQEGDAQLFLISLKAGGVGLNLTAANYIFLMDPWWNPAVENQAIDRAHRIGQENKVTVYRPIIKNSVEEKVLILQQNKRELFNDLLDEDKEYFSGKLTKDDFDMLLS